MWRVLTGLHRCVTLSFMMVGHTKFAPDGCFGLLKRRLRRERVSCLDDLATVVEASGEVNIAQLVGREDGTTYVPVYSWASFLAPHFRRIPQLKKYHHITISCENPRVVSLKLAADSSTETLQLLRDGWAPTLDDLPCIVPPPRLTPERQWYLYNNIREYCTEHTRDIVCPKPLSPQVSRSEDSHDTSEGR